MAAHAIYTRLLRSLVDGLGAAVCRRVRLVACSSESSPSPAASLSLPSLPLDPLGTRALVLRVPRAVEAMLGGSESPTTPLEAPAGGPAHPHHRPGTLSPIAAVCFTVNFIMVRAEGGVAPSAARTHVGYRGILAPADVLASSPGPGVAFGGVGRSPLFGAVGRPRWLLPLC